MKRFLPQTEKLRTEYGEALYAAQTWKRSMEPGRAYQIAWMRYPPAPHLTWNGQMSFPVELTLRAFPEGIRLCREPIDEAANLRVAQHTWKNLRVPAGGLAMPELQADLLDIRAEMQAGRARSFGLTIHGHAVRYSIPDRTLRLDAAWAAYKLPEKGLRLRILVDRSSIEVFAGEGEVSLSAITLENANQSVTLAAEGGEMTVIDLEASQLESIWPDARLIQ